MTAITTSSISIRTAVMITKLAMNQTATVRVMQLGIMFVSSANNTKCTLIFYMLATKTVECCIYALYTCCLR